MAETTTLTFGQQLVGISFNPSRNPDVDRAKALCAELADLVNDNQKVSPASYGYNLIKGKALGEILSAQMLTVKLLTYQN